MARRPPHPPCFSERFENKGDNTRYNGNDMKTKEIKSCGERTIHRVGEDNGSATLTIKRSWDKMLEVGGLKLEA